MPEEDVDRVIARMKEAVRVSLDRELAEAFDLDPSTITRWRKRGYVPPKYKDKAELAARKQLEDQPLSPSYYNIRQGYVFALLGIAAMRLRADTLIQASDADNDVWYGYRLYKLHSWLTVQLAIATKGRQDKDELRESYERVRRRIIEGDLAGWIETLPTPMF